MNIIADIEKAKRANVLYGTLIGLAFFAVTVMGVLVIPGVADAGGNHHHKDDNEPVKGSISVCKVVIDGDGNVVDGSEASGTFEISGLDENDSAGVLPTSSFTTPLTLDSDLFTFADGNDASCETYDDLALGSYYYGEEVVTGDNWLTPLYNDQHTVAAESLSDFFPYSGELFNNDDSDDDARNTNSDGHIILTEDRPDRTLIVLNQFEKADTPYAPYCGDGETNQPWEQCDGGAQCTDQCQFSNQCSEDVFARVNVDDVQNWGTGDITSDIFLGSATNKIKEGTWFLLSGVTDPDISGYEDVPGIAVERKDGQIRLLSHGSRSQAGGTNKEHVDGNIEFFGATVSGQSSDDSGNNKLEKGFDGQTSYSAGQDEVWTEDGNDTQSFFWLTTTTADDGFFTDYTDVEMCVPDVLTIEATKVVCDAEEYLPNWGKGGPDVTETTATDWVAQSDGHCALAPDWQFEWGFEDVSNPGDTLYGVAGGDWNTFGPTDSDGVATVNIDDLQGSAHLWVREVLKDGYIPFTYGQNNATNIDDKSAEMYCHTDVLNYDNYDRIDDPALDETFYCVAFNTLEENHVNQKPVITLIGSATVDLYVGDTYNEEGAHVNDPEDGQIDNKLVIDNSAVDTNTVGSYIVTYNATDSEDLAAEQVERTVKVSNQPQNLTQCNDTVDNDNDGLADTDDPGCHTDGDPNNPNSYDPDDDDEYNPPAYSPYCGNNVIDQAWEQCDGTDTPDGEQCTDQCLFANQCVEIALAKVSVEMSENVGDGNFAEDVYLGSDTNRIPAGVWFPLYVNGTFEDDPDVSGYEDVPGFAVERAEGSLRVVLHGSLTAADKESAKGSVNFFNIDALSTASDNANPLEGPLNVLDYSMPSNDYLQFIDATRVDYALSVNTADDGFVTTYDKDNPPMCVHENQKPMITLIGDNPLTLELYDTYTDPGATASDPEDGDITGDIQVSGDAVDPNTEGSYTVRYNVMDSEGLAADEVTREVIVHDSSQPPACSDLADNDTDGLTDAEDPGCWTDPNDPNTYDPNDNDENQKPVITLRGDATVTVVVGGTYTEDSADVDDPEEGDIDGNLVTDNSSVDTNTEGTYTVTYNAQDSQGANADEVTRTVEVVAATQCSDGVTNDNDDLVDADDPGCWTDPNDPQTYDPNDDSENQKPVITRNGASDIDVVVGNGYSDAGASANDPEDGDITSSIVTDDPVDPNTIGTYTVSYNVTDSDGAAADEVTRTVHVISGGSNPSCTSNCGGGGGGGPIPDSLKIFNEKITVVDPGSALITWDTNKPATSRVVYDDAAHTVSASDLNFGTGSDDLGYDLTTSEDTALTLKHSILITNVDLESTFYFRPISKDATRAIGIELHAVLGTVTQTSCGQYLHEFIKFGANNNTAEVRKLQTFLNQFEGNDLAVNGVYDGATFAAVVAFQNKYSGDVLSPWGLKNDTGYVYLTTRKKINEIYCNYQLPFPLTAAQQAEVNQFRTYLESLEAQGLPVPDTSNVGVAPSVPTLAGGESSEPNVTLTEETVGGEDQNNNNGEDSLASAIQSVESEKDQGGFFNRIGNFFRNLFR